MNKEQMTGYFPADYQFNLSDFALFLSVMKHRRAYECVLSVFLDEPDIQLKEVKVEQVILNRSGAAVMKIQAGDLYFPCLICMLPTVNDMFRQIAFTMPSGKWLRYPPHSAV